MRTDFRIDFFVGIAAALAIGVYCYQLWPQERQVLRHTENLFRRVEQKNRSVVDGEAREGWRAGTRVNQRSWDLARESSNSER